MHLNSCVGGKTSCITLKTATRCSWCFSKTSCTRTAALRCSASLVASLTARTGFVIRVCVCLRDEERLRWDKSSRIQRWKTPISATLPMHLCQHLIFSLCSLIVFNAEVRRVLRRIHYNLFRRWIHAVLRRGGFCHQVLRVHHFHQLAYHGTNGSIQNAWWQ